MGQNTILAAALSTPTADTFVLADVGGTLPDSTTYYYRVSAINEVGETLAFAEVSQATGTGGDPDLHAITVKWLAVTGATGFRVYRSETTGVDYGLIAEVGDVLEWVDDGSEVADEESGLPVANTSGGGAATSTDVTVAAGVHVAVGMFTSDSAGIPGGQHCKVYQDTPGNDLHVGSLNGNAPVMHLVGPGKWRIKRPTIGSGEVVVGLFSET